MHPLPASGRIGVSGLFALILGFFIGGAVASAALRAGVLGVIGFGMAFVFGGIGSFLSVVGTQAMTGNESIFLIIFVFLAYFVIAWGVAGVMAFGLPFRRLGSHVFRSGVMGFAGGGAIGGLIMGLYVSLSERDVLLWLVVALSLVIPPFVGGAVVAQALNPRR